MQPVRRRIVEILKESGAATVAELAELLGMAQVSIRHHLDILMGEDLVELSGLRRRDSAGRPSQMYALTPEAAKLFPQRHASLVNSLLVELKAVLSTAELQAVFQRIADKTALEAPQPQGRSTDDARLKEIAEFLTERGYNARWEMRDGHYELHAHNCPYSGVSDQHPELCMMDQVMMQRLLPNAIRLHSRVIDGANHCTYIIPVAPSSDDA